MAKRATLDYLSSKFTRVLQLMETATADKTLECLEARQKREQKQLVAQITALKKSVTKGEKARRKEVLVEVERLENELKKRHTLERRQFEESRESGLSKEQSTREDGSHRLLSGITQNMQSLKVIESSQSGSNNQKGSRQKVRMVS